MKELQEKFFHYILHPEESKEFSQELIPIGKLKADEVMFIYHNDYHARLQSVFNENFKSIWKILGDDLFFEISRKYRDNYPSAFFDLGLYGDQFSIFLKDQDVSNEFPFLSDLADLEYYFQIYFHNPIPVPASDSEIMGFQEDENLTFIFSESIKIYESDYPILELWEIHRFPEKTLDQIDWRPHQFVLYKNKEGLLKTIELHPLQIELYDLLCRLPVQKAFEFVSEQMDEVTAPLITDFFQFINREGLITGISSKDQ